MKTTFEDLVATTIRLHSGDLAKAIDANKVVAEMLKHMPPPKPLTRMERLQRRLQDVKDAMRVMRGEAACIEWYDE